MSAKIGYTTTVLVSVNAAHIINSLSNQWGFQPRKCAVSVLVDVVHPWSLALDQRKEVGAVLFDPWKAFDFVLHRPLL